MAITSTLAPRYFIRRLLLAALFIGVGVFAGYQGWVTYPAQRTAWLEYQELLALEEQQVQGQEIGGSALAPADLARLDTLRARYTKPPRHDRTEFDIILARWVFVPLCIPIGLFAIITVLIERRKRWVLQDDGTLVAPEGTFPARQITGIDLVRWIDKSIAAVHINGGPRQPGGRSIRLDAFIHDGIEDMVLALEQRFHPERFAAAPPPDDPPANAPAPAASVSGAVPMSPSTAQPVVDVATASPHSHRTPGPDSTDQRPAPTTPQQGR